MGARTKLNTSYTLGALIVAGIGGLITDSIGVFFVVCLILIVSAFACGDIRPGTQGHGHGGQVGHSRSRRR